MPRQHVSESPSTEWNLTLTIINVIFPPELFFVMDMFAYFKHLWSRLKYELANLKKIIHVYVNTNYLCLFLQVKAAASRTYAAVISCFAVPMPAIVPLVNLLNLLMQPLSYSLSDLKVTQCKSLLCPINSPDLKIIKWTSKSVIKKMCTSIFMWLIQSSTTFIPLPTDQHGHTPIR